MAAAVKSDPQKILKSLRSEYFRTERHHLVQLELDRLLDSDPEGNKLPVPTRFTESLETRGFLMIEGAGGGKTTAIERVLARHSALIPAPKSDRPRYLRIQVPNPATLKSLGLALLSELGMPDIARRAVVWDIWKTVQFRLDLLGVVVLWIDEAQELFLSRSSREIEEMLKTLKSVMQGESAVIMILSGTERLSDITGFDHQVDRRFRKIIPRPLVVGHDEKRLNAVVEKYCDKAGLTSEVDDDVLHRDLDGFILRLRSGGVEVNEPSSGMENIIQIAGSLKIPASCVVDLLMADSLKSLELLSTELGFLSVLVAPQEISKALGTRTGLKGVAISTVARELAVSAKAVNTMIEQTSKDDDPALRICGQFRHRGKMRSLIDPNSPEMFHSRF